jgi:hypothetical protein
VSTEVPVDDMSLDELRIAVLRLMASPISGKAVAREANKALDGTADDLRNFLKTGYRLAQAEDDRVQISTILGRNPGKAVVRAAGKALDVNTPEVLRAFLATGYRLAQAEDDRVAVARILADPKTSPALHAAAQRVIDGTPEELRYFIEVGQYEV